MTQRRIYQDDYPYFVTWRMREGYSIFDQAKYSKLLSHIIFETGKLKKYDILSYQIMPNHSHLLVDLVKKSSAPTERCARNKIIIDLERVSAPAMVHQTAPAMGDGYYNISQFMYILKSFFVKELRDRHNISYPIL